MPQSKSANNVGLVYVKLKDGTLDVGTVEPDAPQETVDAFIDKLRSDPAVERVLTLCRPAVNEQTPDNEPLLPDTGVVSKKK